LAITLVPIIVIVVCFVASFAGEVIVVVTRFAECAIAARGIPNIIGEPFRAIVTTPCVILITSAAPRFHVSAPIVRIDIGEIVFAADSIAPIARVQLVAARLAEPFAIAIYYHHLQLIRGFAATFALALVLVRLLYVEC